LHNQDGLGRKAGNKEEDKVEVWKIKTTVVSHFGNLNRKTLSLAEEYSIDILFPWH